MRTLRFQSLLLTVAGFLVFPNAQAKGKKPKPAPKDPSDSIEVVGHISLPDGPVTRFVATQHYSSYYLYAEHGNGKNVTLIDVTHIARPVVLAEVPYPVNGGSATLFEVAGTAALVSEGASAASPAPQPQTIRIMDFSDPLHSQVVREFTGVTSMSRDERRGLTFVANGEGIWILRQTYAEDPEVEKEYARRVLYDR
jgi:hypothetical protein